jgi:RNA polymerase sigma factor (sigma-70 family)
MMFDSLRKSQQDQADVIDIRTRQAFGPRGQAVMRGGELWVPAQEVAVGDEIVALVSSRQEPGEDVADLVARRDEAQRLRQVIAQLPPAEREVIVRRYGLAGPEQTRRSVGKAMGMERKTVRATEVRAMRRLRKVWPQAA